jgi:DNA invertase Pin-like site-specific DNA recombinase
MERVPSPHGRTSTVVKMATGNRMVGYVRVSTNKQEIGPEVQRTEIETAARLQGWDLTLVEEFGISAATVEKRPEIQKLLTQLEAGLFDGLVVSKLDRLSRSTADGARLLSDSMRQGWRIVCLDLGVDTSTIMGAGMFNMALNFAEIERKMIGERTSKAMQRLSATKHMGMPRILPAETVELAVELRGAGMTLQAVADELNRRGLETARGGAWTTSKVQTALNSRTGMGVYRA